MSRHRTSCNTLPLSGHDVAELVGALLAWLRECDHEHAQGLVALAYLEYLRRVRTPETGETLPEHLINALCSIKYCDRIPHETRDNVIRRLRLALALAQGNRV